MKKQKEKKDPGGGAKPPPLSTQGRVFAKGYINETLKTDELCRRLKELAGELVNMPKTRENAEKMKPLLEVLCERGLVRRGDSEMRLLAACCIADALRIGAPIFSASLPLNESALTEFFQLLVSQLQEFSRARRKSEVPQFDRRFYLLTFTVRLLETALVTVSKIQDHAGLKVRMGDLAGQVLTSSCQGCEGGQPQVLAQRRVVVAKALEFLRAEEREAMKKVKDAGVEPTPTATEPCGAIGTVLHDVVRLRSELLAAPVWEFFRQTLVEPAMVQQQRERRQQAEPFSNRERENFLDDARVLCSLLVRLWDWGPPSVERCMVAVAQLAASAAIPGSIRSVAMDATGRALRLSVTPRHHQYSSPSAAQMQTGPLVRTLWQTLVQKGAQEEDVRVRCAVVPHLLALLLLMRTSSAQGRQGQTTTQILPEGQDRQFFIKRLVGMVNDPEAQVRLTVFASLHKFSVDEFHSLPISLVQAVHLRIRDSTLKVRQSAFGLFLRVAREGARGAWGERGLLENWPRERFFALSRLGFEFFSLSLQYRDCEGLKIAEEKFFSAAGVLQQDPVRRALCLLHLLAPSARGGVRATHMASILRVPFEIGLLHVRDTLLRYIRTFLTLRRGGGGSLQGQQPDHVAEEGDRSAQTASSASSSSASGSSSASPTMGGGEMSLQSQMANLRECLVQCHPDILHTQGLTPWGFPVGGGAA
eukprot:Cvel_11278.t1-p1 / transcript=Cvel_11278.t1 / gene=Cvel_11278 / organism=Chromera_velia_CCMP2878 / gene_product=hypothetical protein / transcript_product=hypothetical protein / location=Cvel_scaffold704:1-7945(-) / protein_length=702 / sequence_SO=supercontig / SO=protein_coding / is_pseudo=false